MNKVIVIAPHPDDETLGCGGTILRHKAEGDEIYWLIMSTIENVAEYTIERASSRKKEIQTVATKYNFTDTFQASFPTTELDTIPKKKLVGYISGIFEKVKPNIIYIPYVNDVHSDHEAVFSAAVSCTKSFRYPSLRCVRVYETLSETEFGLRPDNNGFKPNLWIDISDYLDQKIEIMSLYNGEIGEHPFPRSEKNLNALATIRGATAGCNAAEAFISIKEVL